VTLPRSFGIIREIRWMMVAAAILGYPAMVAISFASAIDA
jgi:hypothetical protein